MSIVDFILGQRVILIMVGGVIFMLLAAVLLIAVGRIRAALARRKAHKAQPNPQFDGTPVEEPQEIITLSPVAPAKPKAAAPPPTLSAAPPAAVEAEADKPKSELQDILNSVFTDDEYSKRRRVVLSATEPIDIQALLAQTESVAQALGVKREASS